MCGKAAWVVRGEVAHTGSASAIHMPKSGSSSTSHPPGASQGGYPSQQVHAGGDMHEHRSCVDEIERVRRKCVGADVVPEDLDVRGVYLGQEPQLKVGGDHVSGRADEARQPPGDRPSPPADLQAPSALSDSQTLNAPPG
jgi:hypothetical protein